VLVSDLSDTSTGHDAATTAHAAHDHRINYGCRIRANGKKSCSAGACLENRAVPAPAPSSFRQPLRTMRGESLEHLAG